MSTRPYRIVINNYLSETDHSITLANKPTDNRAKFSDAESSKTAHQDPLIEDQNTQSDNLHKLPQQQLFTNDSYLNKAASTASGNSDLSPSDIADKSVNSSTKGVSIAVMGNMLPSSKMTNYDGISPIQVPTYNTSSTITSVSPAKTINTNHQQLFTTEQNDSNIRTSNISGTPSSKAENITSWYDAASKTKPAKAEIKSPILPDMAQYRPVSIMPAETLLSAAISREAAAISETHSGSGSTSAISREEIAQIVSSTISNMRVYVLESDITDAQNSVKSIVELASF